MWCSRTCPKPTPTQGPSPLSQALSHEPQTIKGPQCLSLPLCQAKQYTLFGITSVSPSSPGGLGRDRGHVLACSLLPCPLCACFPLSLEWG